ncbi:TonB family protein [Thalassotalea litorea]|uniref:TonB family protein n=1 Tax=Thalassotalea litorea TaxID=2020715 RepID=UPI00373681AD
MRSNWLDILQQLSYTLGHFLWQGLIIALLLRVSLFCIHKNQAQLRYLCAVFALIACFIAPAYTFFHLLNASPIDTGTTLLPWLQDLVQSTQHMVLSQGFVSTLQITHILAIAWILIVSVLLVKFIVEFTWTQNVRRQQILAPTSELQNQFTQLVQQLKLNRPVQLLLSFHISSPMTLGFIKPVIMLPAQLVTGLNKEQLELVLLHELIHIKRYDYAVNLCQALIELLLFFHPAVHWIGRQIRLERECICDQQVLSHRQATIQYARLMTDLADYHQASSDLAIAASGGELTQRVQRILEEPQSPSKLNTLIPLTLIAGVFVTLTSLSVNSPWQAVIGNSALASQAKTEDGAVEQIAPASIAHWLLNPDDADVQEQKQRIQHVAISELATPNKMQDNPVHVIVEQLTSMAESEASDIPSQYVMATDKTAQRSPFKNTPTANSTELNIPSSDSKSESDIIARASLGESNPVNVIQNDLGETPDLEDYSQIPVRSQSQDPLPLANQMTVFANKAEKQVVLPVIKLQDDLSGQAQLLKSHQLIAKTYPNIQEQADIIEAQVLKSYAPKYPKLAARRKLSKAVQVSFVIDVAGRVKELDFEDDRQVRYFKGSISEAMKKWRFKPATINGKPIESSMTKIFDFNLEG